MRKSSIALVAMLLWPALAAAQQPAPTATPPQSPVTVQNLVILPWKSDASLVCLDFTNASDKPIQAIRFGFTYTPHSVLNDNDASVLFTGDRTGSFAPGVAILGPKKAFGMQIYGGKAMTNCWSNDEVTNVQSTLAVTVQKVVYADGTPWVNPDPSQIATTVSY